MLVEESGKSSVIYQSFVCALKLVVDQKNSLLPGDNRTVGFARE